MSFTDRGGAGLLLQRISGLFHRYAARHLQISGPAQAILDPQNAKIGEITELRLVEHRLHLAGWCQATRLELRLGETRIAQPLSLPDARGGFAFSLELPWQSAPANLRLWQQAESFDMPVNLPGAFWPKQRLKLRFIGDALRAVPGVIGWALTRDQAYRTQVKRAFGLELLAKARPLRDDLFGQNSGELEPETGKMGTLSLILPVYNAFDLLPEVLACLLDNTDLPYRLLIIEDGSSDPEVRPYLRQWHAGLTGPQQVAVTVIENPENLGFVGSVNKGLAWALQQGNHVVLINSDAFVPRGWASRLLAPIFSRPEVATVTPMSNDAEIFTVPAICQRLDLKPGQAEAIDAVARQFAPEATQAPAPTGVGFCMAMNINHLRQAPQLDRVFGRGYGEEVDWCQKLRTLGAVHLGLGGLFVEHRGGSAFGSAEKLRLVTQNNAIISGRYPYYDQEVQSFLQDDPMISPRLALALAWAGSLGDQPVPVYLAHSLEGGAEKYLQNRIGGDLQTIGAAVVLRLAGAAARWQLEVHSPGGQVLGATDDLELLVQLLDPLTSRHLIYSNAVGDRDPLEIPALMLRLKRPGDRLEVLFHDFFPISPSYTLLDSAGCYHGPVTAEQSHDRAHHSIRPDGTSVSLAQWQAVWGGMVEAADRVVVFSDDSRNQVIAAYPKAQITVVPHQLLQPVPKLPTPQVQGQSLGQNRRVIAALGNINAAKGAGVLVELARQIRPVQGLSLVLIGNIDPGFALPKSAVVHGDYRVEELPSLAARYGITDWLIPSIWPETFSYTTHEALATGLPVYCFDLGAQAEAVAAVPNGHLVDFDGGGHSAEALLDAFQNQESDVALSKTDAS